MRISSSEKPDVLPALTVAISTIGSRVAGIDPFALVAADGVRFLIILQDKAALNSDGTLQQHVAALEALPEVQVITSSETGISKSRNLAIGASETELILFADDDVSFNWAGINAMRAWFAGNPNVTIAWGRSSLPGGELRKTYPPHGSRLRFWNCGRIGWPELAARIAPLRAQGIEADVDFGLGTAQNLGEEYIFVTDCVKAGLEARHIDAVFCSHPYDSSAAGWSKPEMAKARAAVFTRVFGRWAPLVRIAYAFRSPDKFNGIGHAWRFIAG